MITLTLLPKRSLLFALILLLYAPLLYGQRPALDFGAKTIPNKVVYKLKPQQASHLRKSTDQSMSQALQQIGAKQVNQKFPGVAAQQTFALARKAAPAVDLSQIYELQYTPGHTFEEVRSILMATGQVAYVEPLFIREPLHQPNDPASDSTKTTQYYLKQVQAYGGWEVEQGDTTVVIGILDTGFRLTHVDLQTKVKLNHNDPIDGIDNDGDGFIDNYRGWDFADNDNDVTDNTAWRGHGTAVAGVAAGATNNGTGMAGLSYNALFMPIKVFSSYNNGPFGGYEAIVYAANNGCKIINLSWGGTGFSAFEQDVINYAVLEKDVLIVASGGNTNAYLNIYPASYDNVLSVGGANNQDVKFKDHTFSYTIDLISPSSNIYSTSVLGDERYGNVGGTSFAAPTVAGGAALVRSHFPELNARQVAERLRASTDEIYTLDGNKAYLEMLGTGRFNLKKALKSASLKAVRCLSFAPFPNQSMSAGSTVAIDASFVNYLAAADGLQITLSSLSPYVSVEQGNASFSGLGTMATVSTGEQPFVIKISGDSPANHKVFLRLGYSDGDYSGFQHFELVINPNFATLTANNLHLTLNSEGNIGYNGLNMKQGVGVKYKDGASLLFEGGLILSATNGKVADNLHNDSWQNSKGFEPTMLTRSYYNTKLADQEIRSLMQTKVDGHPEVEVKTLAYAWATEPDQDYVILEYQITNNSSEAIPYLHAGLFADWDIGNYTENKAGWDSELQMGYAYHTYSPLPYAGIKLLTTESQPIYHAIDNIGGNDSTIAVDDGFSDAEKYKIVSNGMSRLKAGGEYGNSISHILGATALDLAPGQTKIIAFAVLAGDNLAAMKQHAQAAQKKYKSMKSGPAPSSLAYQVCNSDAVVIAPEGGSYFNFYNDSDAKELLASGSSLTISNATSSTIYVANADSMYLSALVPMQIEVLPISNANFKVTNATSQVNKTVIFKDESINASSWHWDFGDGGQSQVQQPMHKFTSPGTYTVTLTTLNKLDCTRSTYQQLIDVYDVEPKLYPNPAIGKITLNLTAPLSELEDSKPELRLTDMAGKTMAAAPSSISSTQFQYDLSPLSAGVYIAHISYQGEIFVRRVLVRK
ncbi:S8 family serine peptidase [uncultured Pontibacter sp.]|uniref:S8 family serine peptidase n=1 Tax=uncultured Pontibacter sp. TaxID=453356 RepID=UPI00261567AD|nr:S8 family serine peptidase [uncultured Pontibacter sp.]